MTIELTVAVSLFCTMLGAVLALMGYRRTAQKDAALEARSGAVIATELNFLKANTERIQQRQSDFERQLNTLTLELSKLTASAASINNCLKQLGARMGHE